MTTYTFVPKASTQFVQWSDPSVWVGKTVPNAPDADVQFPVVTYAGSDQTYTSFVNIAASESFAVRSVDLNDYLILDGALSVSGSLVQNADGEIDLRGTGTLTAGSLTVNAYDVQGNGTVTVGTLQNNQLILASNGNLTINAGSIANPGTLAASQGTLFVNVAAAPDGGSADIWSKGTVVANPGGIVRFNTGSLMTEDDGVLTLAGGGVDSIDPSSGKDVPLATSLHRIGAAGTLNVTGGAYDFDNLTIAGNAHLYNRAGLSVDHLTVAAGGAIDGIGSVTGQIVNDGTITASAAGASSVTAPLVLNGSVDGSGILAIGPINSVMMNGVTIMFSATLEVNGAVDQKVVFADHLGTLQIDQPASFTGSISPTGAGDNVLLENVALNSVTGLSYAGDEQGGTLTLQQAGGAILLHFVGNYTTADFSLSAGPQKLSSDPASLYVTIVGPDRVGGQTHNAVQHDFDGSGTADILWRRADGLVTDWLSSAGHADDNPGLLRPVGLDWHIQGTGDFNGDGRVDILWRNDSGVVTDWLASGTGYADNPLVMRQVGNDWRIAGTGDFNGDGRADVLWRNADGTVTDWLSDGTHLNDNATALRAVGNDWHIAGTGDFNGDGRTDILWRNDNGLVTDWLSNNNVFSDNVGMSRQAGLDWKIVGTGDFNGDGKTDVLWRSADNVVTAWLSDGSQFNDSPTVTRSVGSDWQVQGTGDFNGDGRTDVLWRSNGGEVTEWLATATGFTDNPNVARYVGADWTIFGA